LTTLCDRIPTLFLSRCIASAYPQTSVAARLQPHDDKRRRHDGSRVEMNCHRQQLPCGDENGGGEEYVSAVHFSEFSIRR
jgi:hypothetical protein